jgi:hypothetical protein
VGAWEFRYVALLVTGLLVYYGLRTYHRRRMVELETRELELEGWVKLKLAAIDFAWQCPECGLPALTAEGQAQHQLSSTSACAWFAERMTDELERAEAQAAQGQGTRVTVAQVPDDPWPAIGAGEDAEGES